MKKQHFFLLLLFCTISFIATYGQDKSFDELDGAEIRVYKSVDGVDLKMSIIYPEDYKKGKKYPAIVFFFGGGWNKGTVQQFEQHCHYLASRGMIAMTANYRVKSRNQSTPYDAVEDAKSAIRWVRENAKELGVKKNKIVTAGGSAGGHLAACTGIIPGYDVAGENLKISSVPNAMILFNPVANTMPNGIGIKRLGDKAETISPAHYVVKKLPPTLIFHGTDDTTVPYETITDFQSRMEIAGNTCEVMSFEGQGHGFFNYGRSEHKYYYMTIEKMEEFLTELKFIRVKG